MGYTPTTFSTNETPSTAKWNQLGSNDAWLYQQTNSLWSDAGSGSAYAINPTVPLPAYVAGTVFSFVPANTSSGAATLNVSGLGAKAIQYGGQALPSGYISKPCVATVVYDGTAFQLVNPASKILNEVSISSDFTSTTTPAVTGITGLSMTINPPAGAYVELEFGCRSAFYNGSAGTAWDIILLEGTSTILQEFSTNQSVQGGVSVGVPVYFKTAPFVPTSNTVFAAFDMASSGTFTVKAASGAPAFIRANLV